MSRAGTAWLRQNPFAGADVPARVAVAQQRLHAVHAAEQKNDRHQEGEVRQRRQQLDRELWNALRISCYFKPSRTWRPAAGLQRAKPVVKRPEIHVIHAQRHARKSCVRSVTRDHRALAMNAFLAEAVIGRQLDFDGDDLAQRGQRQAAASSPRQAIRIPLRLMFSVYIALRIQSAGDVTWHRSLISMRGLSRRLMFFISLASTLANLALQVPCASIS